jgi:predicted nucleic acid-binding protein
VIYLDSSALVKRYIKEIGSERVESMMNSTTNIATSKLAYPELLSVFWRKYRERDISREGFDRIVNEFEADWEYLHIIEFKNDLLSIIKKLFGEHSLRGADTVHLASALWLKKMAGRGLTFVASDLNLIKAAEKERLVVINPNKDSD